MASKPQVFPARGSQSDQLFGLAGPEAHNQQREINVCPTAIFRAPHISELHVLGLQPSSCAAKYK